MTSLGDLFDSTPSDPFCSGVKAVAHNFLPSGWREWRVSLPAQLDCKVDRGRVRFALPSIELAKIFNPGVISISESQFREMNNALLNIPLCLALVYNPSKLTRSLRTSDEDYNLFMEAIKPLQKFSLSLAELNRKIHSANKPSSLDQLRANSPDLAGNPPPLSLTSPAPPSSLPPTQEVPDPVQSRLTALEEKLQGISALEAKFDSLSHHLIRLAQAPPAPPERTEEEYYSEEDYYSDHSEL